MPRSSWSPSPSPSPTSTDSSPQKQLKTDKIPAKCLIEIPLLPIPVINCNLPRLDNAEFVNVVFESDSDNQYFRTSDENNEEIFRITPYRQAERKPKRKGVKYLECCDLQGNCILYIAYPIGLGEVALLSPKEELIGECQSNVEFICLSVKVKYNFFDTNGNRLMKMTSIMPEEGSGNKFMVMVKRSKNEKLALIKMGSLKSCCQIKFKAGQVSKLEKLQIICMWAGFMHNEIQDNELPNLLDRQAQAKKEKESQSNKSFIAKAVVNGDGRESENGHSEEQLEDNMDNNSTTKTNEVNDNMKRKTTLDKVILWKNLVAAQFSRRQNTDHDNDNRLQYGSNNNVNDIGNDERSNGTKDQRSMIVNEIPLTSSKQP